MLPQEIIRLKRDGQPIPADALKQFVTEITADKVSEGQIAAFCMATYFKGMSIDERVALTKAMRDSGTTSQWPGLDGPVVDKHSTGGVGDKVSLLLAPIVAACGGYVPMIAGRGLGHTGGTVDKMDGIPGYSTKPELGHLRDVVKNVGCAVIGQTDDIAPADRRIYSIRDVTSTVESIDLITASILSKKLAAGLDYLVMDVKFGSGAFMKNYEDAVALADSIVQVATGAGTPTVALLTDMNEILGWTAGNNIEVRECLDILSGKAHEPRIVEVTLALCAEMLHLSGIANTAEEARAKVEKALSSGKAAEIFAKMISELGGPKDLFEKPDLYLPLSNVKRDIYPDQEGYLTAIDTYEVGMSIVQMGGGRVKPTDPIDHRVGIDSVAGLGAKLGKQDQKFCTLYARTEDEADLIEKRLKSALTVSDTPIESGPLVKDRRVAR